jgi:hypothetical protein
MNEAERARFNALGNEYIPLDLAEDILGLDVREEDVRARLDAFVDLSQSARSVFVGGGISRFLFEEFLNLYKLYPLRTAANRLGLDVPTLVAVLDRLATLRRLAPRAESWGVSRAVIDHLSRYFGELKNRVFGNHDDMCSRLHAAISHELNISVVPVRCTTSSVRHDGPPDYAYAFCPLSLEPTSIRYQVWLNFGKWLRLEPDFCSLKFYAANRTELSPLIFGSEPDVSGLPDQ